MATGMYFCFNQLKANLTPTCMNSYNVKIPEGIPAGNYIMRFELIAFGQSSGVEGGQDQYYPYALDFQLDGLLVLTS